MMILENDKCYIKIEEDVTYTVDSVDNRHYDLILNPGQYRRRDFTKTFSISIDLFSREFSIALIGPFYSYDSDCAVLNGNILTVLQDNTITQIKVSDGSIVHYTTFDCIGGCFFAMYQVKKGYIICGEVELILLDFEFEKKWSFFCVDIFVSVSEIHEDVVCLYDLENNYYEIDYDGNLVTCIST